jgi:acyl carrier protein
MQAQDIQAVIIAAAREVAEREQIALPADVGADLPLFGPQSRFDSLGLVSLIVAVEQEISACTGRTLALADERALSQTRSPFRKRLHAYCRDRLARFKIPRKVEVVAEGMHGPRFKKMR